MTAYADHGGPGEPVRRLRLSRQPGKPWPRSVTGLKRFNGKSPLDFCTALASPAAIRKLLQDSRYEVELAEPVVPQRAPRPWTGSAKSPPVQRTSVGPDTGGEGGVLIGIIDDGCPFAHGALRRPDGQSRILKLWDQGSGASWSGLGSAPAGLYGWQLDRDDLGRLMRAVSDPTGQVDEHRCYLRAGYGAAMPRASHGAHSLGMLVGALVHRHGRRREPPAKADDGPSRVPASASADIVFVQLPHEVMRCVSVGALEAHAFEGARYVVAQAKERNCKRVVISFGYESWVGPHDGSDWFCRALDALAGSDATMKIEVHMPAGNGRSRHAHVAAQGSQRVMEWALQVHPDNEVPTYVEFWAPAALTDLKLTVTPPRTSASGTVEQGAAMVWPDASKPSAVVVSMLRGDALMGLLRIAPTRVHDPRQAAAPSGRWTLRVEAQQSLAGFHAYIGRSEETVGASRRSRQSVFVARPPTALRSDMRGTFNGHALGASTTMAGAYYRTDFPYPRSPTDGLRSKQAEYCGEGPGRGGPGGRPRQRADVYVAVEDGLFLSGAIGIGNRSATQVRMSGTSLAAPLSARRSIDAGQGQDPKQRAGPPAPPRPGSKFDPFA